MTANIIIIGDEILLGRVTDTNSGAIARGLDTLAINIGHIYTVGDNAEDITKAINRSLAEVPLTITTGGLGPTKDDITKKVLTTIFGGTLIRDDSVTANINEIFARRGLTMNALTADQALVPTSCRVIQNRLGTAPIMWFEREDKVLISMPGVPFETEGMLQRAVIGEIARHFCRDSAITHRTAVVAGITESALAMLLEDFENSLPDGFHLAYLPDSPVITLRLDAQGSDHDLLENRADSIFEELKRVVAKYLISDHAASVAQILTELLRSKSLTTASAESCTGGNIARQITAVAGCSDVYVGSVVSYANEVKMSALGVSQDTLNTHGAVSRETVEQMASGVMHLTGATTAMATSGIAGPSGGTADKPVGTVWIATATPKGIHADVYRFPGDRSRVIARATATAMLNLIFRLKDNL